MQPGQAEKRTHDYVRHGTTTSFAALEIATGQVTGVCKPRHRHHEFLVFLRHLARGYPDQQLHLIMDNYAAHKHPKVKAWLAANPRIHIHFTPTSGSWLNLVEVWFGIIERQAIHRGAFPSVRDLMIKIRAFINGWNDRCQPFVWTKTADQILTKANRKQLQLRSTSRAPRLVTAESGCGLEPAVPPDTHTNPDEGETSRTQATYPYRAAAPATAAEGEAWRLKWILIVIGAIVAAFILLVIIGLALGGEDEDTAAPQAASHRATSHPRMRVRCRRSSSARK